MIELDHLSYSSISSYLTCGVWWHFKYAKRLPTRPSAALFFGSVFHDAMGKIIAQNSLGLPVNILYNWINAWKIHMKDEGENTDWGEESAESIFNDGLRILSNPQIQYDLNTLRAGLKDDSLLIEQKVELRIPKVPIPIIGYIDMIDTNGIPCDFKTSSRSWNEEQARNEIQPLFYLAAMKQMDIPVDGRFRHYVLVKTKNPQLQMLESRRKPTEENFLFSMIGKVWRGIEANIFIANPSTWKCNPKYCEFWSLCRSK